MLRGVPSGGGRRPPRCQPGRDLPQRQLLSQPDRDLVPLPRRQEPPRHRARPVPLHPARLAHPPRRHRPRYPRPGSRLLSVQPARNPSQNRTRAPRGSPGRPSTATTTSTTWNRCDNRLNPPSYLTENPSSNENPSRSRGRRGPVAVGHAAARDRGRAHASTLAPGVPRTAELDASRRARAGIPRVSVLNPSPGRLAGRKPHQGSRPAPPRPARKPSPGRPRCRRAPPSRARRSRSRARRPGAAVAPGAARR